MMKTMDFEADFANELETYRRRCIELKEKSKNDELRCLMLEVEVGDLRKKKEELEAQITRIQKVVSNEEKGKGMMVDLTGEEDDGDKFVQLMIENKVLECEKTKAETELRYWKEKVKELVLQVCELESKANMKVKNESSMDTSGILIDEEKVKVERGEMRANLENHSQVRKRLPFEEDGYPNKKISAPSTPGVARPPFFGVIDISDEDVNYGDMAKSRCSPKNEIKTINLNHIDGGYSRIAKIVKRKRASNIITSEDEDDDDDNALICTLRTPVSWRLKTDVKGEVKDVRRQRLTRLRNLESENKQDKSSFDLNGTYCLHGNSSSESEEDDDDGESLGGFIVESSESCNESEDALNEFKVTLDKIRRKKDSNLKWDLEGDMLANFGKDPELCMRAVCALYRQQTADEKSTQGTIHQNERGFSQTDAFRASKLAEFLTDGDSVGDLNKTVEELKRYDSKGIELCMALAAKYSKQLFAIYQNKEDQYFLPQ